jgi:hypothetical protein
MGSSLNGVTLNEPFLTPLDQGADAPRRGTLVQRFLRGIHRVGIVMAGIVTAVVMAVPVAADSRVGLPAASGPWLDS